MSTQDHPVDIAGHGSGEDAAPSGLIEAADVPGGGDHGPAALSAQPSAPSSDVDVMADRDTAVDPETAVDEAAGVDTAVERRALLELLIYAWDRARSPGVWERLTAGLAAIGVSVERPDGAPFDPARHEVGGVQCTDDPALVDTVAETEVVGFTDRGSVLREPIVVVYRRG